MAILRPRLGRPATARHRSTRRTPRRRRAGSTAAPIRATFTPVVVVAIDSGVPDQPVASIAPGSSRNPTRSARARATRERIVPIGQSSRLGRLVVAQPEHLGGDERGPPIAIELGEQVVELGDLARHRESSPAGRRGAAGAGVPRRRRRVESTQTRRAIVRIQWRAGPSARYRCSDPIARSNVSWARSSAVSGSPRYRHIFHTSRCVSAMNRSRAAWSPSRAAIRSWVR